MAELPTEIAFSTKRCLSLHSPDRPISSAVSDVWLPDIFLIPISLFQAFPFAERVLEKVPGNVLSPADRTLRILGRSL